MVVKGGTNEVMDVDVCLWWALCSDRAKILGVNSSLAEDGLSGSRVSREDRPLSTDEDPQLRNLSCVRVGAHVAMYRGSGLGQDSSHTLYVCTHYGCTFRTHSYSTNLRNHLAEHFGDRPFICGDCEYRSERFDSLRKHCRVHTGERPYACPVCGYRSKTNSNLHAHIRTKHNMPSGKAERMPSICAQYDTTTPASSAHNLSSVGANASISSSQPGSAGLSIGSGSVSVAAVNGTGHGSSGGEGSGSSPESGPRYHEVPLSINPLPLPLALPLSLTGAFQRQATSLTPIGLPNKPLIQPNSNGASSPGERQPLDYSMGMFGPNRTSI